MRKTCIKTNGTRIQDVTPDSFSFSDEDSDACAAYNNVKASDYYNVVTLVHNGSAIGYCSYKFGGTNEDSENIFITINIDFVFITQAHRGNGYSNFLASYVAFDYVNYVKDMTNGSKPYNYSGINHFISDDGENFYKRVLQIAYGERPNYL